MLSQCNTPTFVGNELVCGLDSDSDGFPDVELNCDDPSCQRVSECYIHRDTHICTHICRHAHIHISICMCAYTWIHIRTYAQIVTYTHNIDMAHTCHVDTYVAMYIRL